MGTTQNGDHYNYITYTKPSNTLRSSTMHIRDENGNVVGAICINTDITDTIRMEEYLKKLQRSGRPSGNRSGPQRGFSGQHPRPSGAFDQRSNRRHRKTGREADESRQIEISGLFGQERCLLISKSGDRVCDHLHISKFTLYKYLEIVRGENNGSDLDEPAGKPPQLRSARCSNSSPPHPGTALPVIAQKRLAV